MDHWRRGFVNRPLSRTLYVAVRWAGLMELCIALRVRRELTRIGLLCDVDVDFERIDEEQERDHLVALHRFSRPQAGPSPPVLRAALGVWV